MYYQHLEPRHGANPRMMARVVRTLLVDEDFGSLADLSAAVKDFCARKGIPYSADAITEAFRLIASNRELVAHPAPRRVLRERAPDGRPPTRAEAAAILRGLGVTLP